MRSTDVPPRGESGVAENIAVTKTDVVEGDDVSTMDSIEAVCFDLDSTLCLSSQDDAEIHEAIFERVGVDPVFEPADLYAVDIEALPEAESERENYEQLYAAAADVAGSDPGRETLAALAEATLDVIDDSAVTFRPGAEEALTYVREHYAVALLTAGTEATQTEKLDALGVADAFDATVFCGPGTGIETKPRPEPFERVLAALDVAPERAVYVGDRLDGDVAGAHAAGMQSVWVPVGDVPEDVEPEPTYRLESLSALPELL